MLRDMVSVETRALVGLDQLESRLVIIFKGKFVPVQVVEDAEFHITPDIS